MSTTIINKSPVNFTESAINELKNLQIQSPNSFLKIGVKGGGCSGLSYQLEFVEAKTNEEEYEIENVFFVMEKAHELYLYGMTIDWQGGLNSRGFTFTNPNASKTCGCGTSFSV